MLETCKYGTADRTTAEISRIFEEGKVVLYDAKTGREIARKTLRSKPPKCPKSAEFLVTKGSEADKGAAFDQRLDAEVTPDVIAWFDKASQR